MKMYSAIQGWVKRILAIAGGHATISEKKNLQIKSLKN